MADGVTLPAAGTGDTNPKVATDQLAGGEHAQYMKLMDGTADSETKIASGNGTAANALRVAIASDNTAFAVNATLAAETTKVIGTVNVAGAQTIAATNAGTFAVQPAGSVAQDGAAAGVNPVLTGGYASAAAPTDVTADNDSVRAWHLRNGAAATVLTAAGALIGGDATNGLDVDVTRLPALVAGTALIGKVGVDQTTPGTTNAVSLAQLGATTVDSNSGSKSAGTLRVVIATDQPALTNPLLVTLGAETTKIIGTVNIAGSQTIAVTNAGVFATQPQGVNAHDAASAGIAPMLVGGYASAAAPTDVTADNDSVRAWHLRNGAAATTLTAAGALIGGDATNGLDVDVTRMAALVAGSAIVGKVGIDQTTPGTTNLVALTAETTKVIGTVNVAGAQTIATTNAGTFAVQPAGSVAHDGVATSSNPNLIGGYASAAAPTDVSTDGDATRMWVLRNGAQATVLTAAGALIGGDAANGLDVDVTRLPALVAGSALIGKVGVDQTTPGTTNAVSLAQIGATTIVTGGTAGTQAIGGVVANNGTINSAVNPILVGGQAVSSENAAGTTAKLGQFVTDLVGKQIVLPYANPENFVSFAMTTAMTSTTSTITLAAPAAGLRNYITQITVSNSHATVGTDVLIQDGSGGTTIYVIPAASGFGGASITFPVPLRQPSTAVAIYVANVTTGSNTKVSISGYKGV